MESLAKLITATAPSEALTGIAPATVIETEKQRVLLEMNGQRNWSVMALGYRYEAAPGDKLLTAFQNDSWYVIGVLEGAGKTQFVAPGDMSFRAPQGKIELVASEEVSIRGSAVNLTSKKLQLVADEAIQKFSSLEQWVRGTFMTSATKACHKVSEAYRLKAGKIVERAKGDVKIDGEHIKLG